MKVRANLDNKSTYYLLDGTYSDGSSGFTKPRFEKRRGVDRVKGLTQHLFVFSPISFQLRVLLNLNSGSITDPSLLVGPDASNAVKSSSKTTTSTDGTDVSFLLLLMANSSSHTGTEFLKENLVKCLMWIILV